MKPINERNAEIVYNLQIAPGYYRMGIKCARLARRVKPGQFLQIDCGTGYDPLLRRPLSIHRLIADKDILEVLYCLIGKGTRALSELHPGKNLDLIGPLGNGLSVSSKVKNVVLIGGGMGVAPLLFWAQRLETLLRRGSGLRQVYVIIGAKNKNAVLCESDFKVLSNEVGIVTEDGSYGFKGLATAMLDNVLEVFGGTNTGVYACGPKPMLKAISQMAFKYNLLTCQLCLEEYMACGLGVCRGCAIKVKQGRESKQDISGKDKQCHCEDNKKSKPETEEFTYKMVCSDGPVFEASDILW